MIGGLWRTWLCDGCVTGKRVRVEVGSGGAPFNSGGGCRTGYV